VRSGILLEQTALDQRDQAKKSCFFLHKLGGWRYTVTAMEGKSIPVRLSDHLVRRIDAAAARLGLENRSAVIKLCTQAFVEHVERHGRAALPLDYRHILESLDARTRAHRDSVSVGRDVGTIIHGDVFSARAGADARKHSGRGKASAGRQRGGRKK